LYESNSKTEEQLQTINFPFTKGNYEQINEVFFFFFPGKYQGALAAVN